MVNTRLVSAVVLVLVVAGAVAMTQGFELSIPGLEPTNCEWQEININGETWDSLEQFETDWNENSDTNFSELESMFDFRTQDNVLEYRTCTVQGGGST